MDAYRNVFVLLAIATFARGDEPAGYAKPYLLIEAETLREELERSGNHLLQQARQVTEEWLANRGRGEYTLVDVRTQPAGPTIGDARGIDARAWAAAFGDGTNSKDWSVRIGEVMLRRGPKSTVVVFDETLSPAVARVWWILKYWGVEDVRILNGGVKAWRASGGKLAVPAKVQVMSAPDDDFKGLASRLASTTEVRQLLGARQMIDCRSNREFAAGAIPGATHLDWRELVDSATGKLRSADELRARFAAAAIDLEQPVVTYCQTGGRGSVTAFALELMGAEQVTNYYGSWGEWSKRTAD